MSPPAAARGLAGRVSTFGNPEALAAAAAKRVVELSERNVRDHGHFAIALAGGETPKRLYEQLAGEPFRSQIDWNAWRVYFGDERAVRPDSKHSNYRMARLSLLAHVPIAQRHLHRMHAERDDLDAAAAEYSTLLDTTVRHGGSGVPRLDLVLLGLGENGHCASLFPGTPALEVTGAWATRGLADYAPFDRMTLTFPAINAALNVMFLVSGATKAQALAGVAAGTVPSSCVRPVEGSLQWYLDREAASLL
ncbi:MAG TPA: 6-phosphogluconolactonase [Candidatus Dormibacteraeota bacterium]|nr:6-phosphogluconolactonase [Candidatus Dormibacteraeota bacterium]